MTVAGGDRRQPAGWSGLCVLLLVAWALIVPYLLLRADFQLPDGQPLSAAEIADAHRWRVWAAIVAIALPAIGLGLAIVTPGHAVVGTLLGIALVISVAVVLFNTVFLAEARQPTPPDPHPHCQAYSGGSDNCPGG